MQVNHAPLKSIPLTPHAHLVLAHCPTDILDISALERSYVLPLKLLNKLYITS